MDNQYYEIDGVKFDRVTSILNIIHDSKLESFQRARGFDYVDDIFQEAAERGKIFHSAMKLIADGKYSGMIEESFKSSEMYDDIVLGKAWIEKNVKKVLYTESKLFDKSLNFGGTVDLIYRGLDDKIYLLDWKTGTIISPKFRLQIGAYTDLAEKNLNIKIDNRLIIQVNSGKLKELPIKTSKLMDINLFKYCLYLHREVR